MGDVARTDYRFEIIMDAGNGAQKAGDILIKTLAKLGRHVFIEPMIPAEISPPKRTPYSMSGVIIRFSTQDLSNIGSFSDFMIVEHEILLQRRLEDRDFGDNARILLDMGDEPRNSEGYAQAMTYAKELGLNVVPFYIQDEARSIMKEMGGLGKNLFYLGILSAYFAVPLDNIEKEIRTAFKRLSSEKLDKNMSIYKLGSSYGPSLFDDAVTLPDTQIGENKILIDGNTAIARGLIDAGVKLYSGYPITPASSILHSLAQDFAAYGGILHQAEDEISAIGTVVGSYFGDVPAATGTSGPGLSLKQEFIGYAATAEIPLILINVQRGGPSTGMPTKHEQSDLPALLYGCHGDNTKIILSVSNVVDCFYAPHVARYLTETCRMPVIIASDYLMSVSYKVVTKPPLEELDDSAEISDSILARFHLKRLPDSIEMVKDNQSIPGPKESPRRVTGLNTNEEGTVLYSSETNIRSHRIRNQKVSHVKAALQAPDIIGEDQGDLLIVGWGSAAGAIQEAVDMATSQGLKVGGLNFKMIYPLPPDLTTIFSKYKSVYTVEVAYGDQDKPAPLAGLLRQETLCDVRSLLSEPTGRPLKPITILSHLKEVVS